VVPATQTSILVGDGLDSESCGGHHTELKLKLHHGLVRGAATGATVLSRLAVAVAMIGGSS
jgi:hypothetical protein